MQVLYMYNTCIILVVIHVKFTRSHRATGRGGGGALSPFPASQSRLPRLPMPQPPTPPSQVQGFFTSNPLHPRSLPPGSNALHLTPSSSLLRHTITYC